MLHFQRLNTKNFSKRDIACKIIANLWEKFISSSSYKENIQEFYSLEQNDFHIDHLSFRSLFFEEIKNSGINSFKGVLALMGYSAQKQYEFSEENKTSIYFSHYDPSMPKIMVSEVDLKNLVDESLYKKLSHFLYDSNVEVIDNETTDKLNTLGLISTDEKNLILTNLLAFFENLNRIPSVQLIEQIESLSEYVAWVVFFRNSVHHVGLSISKHYEQFEEEEEDPKIEEEGEEFRPDDFIWLNEEKYVDHIVEEEEPNYDTLEHRMNDILSYDIPLVDKHILEDLSHIKRVRSPFFEKKIEVMTPSSSSTTLVSKSYGFVEWVERAIILNENGKKEYFHEFFFPKKLEDVVTTDE